MRTQRETDLEAAVERLTADNEELNESVKKFIAADAECERLTAENERLRADLALLKPISLNNDIGPDDIICDKCKGLGSLAAVEDKG